VPPKRKRAPRKRAPVQPVAFLDDETRPWDRQPKETEAAWEAFVLYRDAMLEGGIGRRSQRLVCARLRPDRDPTTARTREIGGWSVKWRWRERALAFDAHLDRERQEEFRAAARRDAYQNVQVLRAMRGKGAQAIVALSANEIKAADAVRMIDVAVTGIRREAGLATEIQSTERDNAFAEWLTRGGDPDDGEDDAPPPDEP
jgi:hypothetical protein